MLSGNSGFIYLLLIILFWGEVSYAGNRGVISSDDSRPPTIEVLENIVIQVAKNNPNALKPLLQDRPLLQKPIERVMAQKALVKKIEKLYKKKTGWRLEYYADSDSDDEDMSSESNQEGVVPRTFSDLALIASEVVHEDKKKVVISRDYLYREIMSALVSNSSSAIGQRMQNIDMALAAGEEDEQIYGIWMASSKAFAKQDDKNIMLKSHGYNISFGLDGKMSDDLLLGIAFAKNFFDANYFYHDNPQETDNRKLHSYITSLYFANNIDDNWGLTGQFKLGNVRLALTRESGDADEYSAFGDTKARLYGASLAVSHNWGLSDVNLSSTISAIYNQYNMNGFQEYGLGSNNYVSAIKSESGLLSLSNKLHKSYNWGEWKIKPSIYLKLIAELYNKSNDTKITPINYNTGPIAISNDNSKKIRLSLGGGVNISRSELADITIGYDYTLRHKYYMHSGFVKFRANF